MAVVQVATAELRQGVEAAARLLQPEPRSQVAVPHTPEVVHHNLQLIETNMSACKKTCAT